MYVIDTNILVDFLKGKLPYGYELMRESEPGLFKIPAIVAAELLLGAEKSKQRDTNILEVERLLLPFEIVPFDKACMRHYARIRAQLEKMGTPIGPNDLIIASIAVAHAATLVTNNSKEFQRVPGLVIENWEDIDFD